MAVHGAMVRGTGRVLEESGKSQGRVRGTGRVWGRVRGEGGWGRVGVRGAGAGAGLGLVSLSAPSSAAAALATSRAKSSPRLPYTRVEAAFRRAVDSGGAGYRAWRHPPARPRE